MIHELSDSSWLVEETGFDADNASVSETLLTVGNGYHCVRGSFEEGHKGERSGFFLSGVYDQSDATVIHMVNVTNWLAASIFIEGEKLDLLTSTVIDHRRVLDMQTGLLQRRTVFEDSHGRQTEVKTLRFASFANQHLVGERIQITALNHDSAIEIVSTLDGERDNLDCMPAFTDRPKPHPEVKWDKWAKSRHLETTARHADASGSYLEVRTLETDITIGMASAVVCEGASSVTGRTAYQSASQTLQGQLSQGQTLTFDKTVCIYTSRDEGASNVRKACEAGLKDGLDQTLDGLVQESVAAWRAKWEASDIVVSGDDAATHAARFNIYHLLITANENDPRANIGAKSMSGEGYRGHVFWDTEVFMLPFYIYTQPETARALLLYRYNTMKGAMENARSNGFEGAQYPWESADSGVETTPKWTHDGVHRIWTGEEEIHITACVAYGIMTYVTATGDWDFMLSHGAEILYETSRYWISRLEHNADEDRFELTTVIGPDEFHEHVDNNTFTNALAQWHLQCAARIFERYGESDDPRYRAMVERLGISASDAQTWQNTAEKIYIPRDESSTLVEQFSGYFKLEDIPITQWDENDMPLYPEGHDHFSLNASMLLKQPDVIMLMYMLPDAFNDEEKRENFAFYEARTMHKSSLSPAIHAIMGVEVGDYSRAHRYFERSAFVDLVNNQGNTEDGMHIASAGGTWQALVCGFGGFRVKNGQMSFKPWLPEGWDALEFKLQWKGGVVSVKVSQTACHLRMDTDRKDAETVTIAGKVLELIPGQELVSAY